MGFIIDFNNQHLRIKIPRWINQNGNWVDPLDGKEIDFRFVAKVKENVMLDTSITHVHNSSTIDFGGLDWEVQPDEKHDSVKIIRQGGWANGTKPGELKITKIIKNKKIPIKDVEFTLERSDGGNIEVKQEDGSYLNMGSSVILLTNKEGIANIKGLRPASYIVKETKAPDWIEFDVNQPIKKEFTVDSNDSEGSEYTIENQKKNIDIYVTKKWEDASGQKIKNVPSNVQVQLYRNDEKLGHPITLNKFKLKYIWKNLEKADDNGINYTYSVKEEGETSGKIKFKGKWFNVIYSGDVESGFTVTNKEVPPLTPLVPSTRSIKVTKSWQESNGSQMQAPIDEITVELFKNGQATGNIKKLTMLNNWTATFENLKVSEIDGSAYEYTVKEHSENAVAINESESVKFNGKWFKVSYNGDMQTGFTVTNKNMPPWTPLVPSKREIRVTKSWQESNGSQMQAPVDEITVELFKNGQATGTTKKLSSANGWTATFENLKVSEIDGSAYEYTVKEHSENGTSTEEGGQVKFNGKWFKVSYNGDMQTGFTVTNKNMPPWTPLVPSKREIRVTKSWQESNGSQMQAPIDEITVELFKNGQATGTTKKLTRNNNWTVKFDNLDVSGLGGNAYEYTVKEVGESNGSIKLNGKYFKVIYEGNIHDGFKIVNRYEEPKKPKVPTIHSPKTGDSFNLFLYSFVLGLSSLGLLMLELFRIKEAKEN